MEDQSSVLQMAYILGERECRSRGTINGGQKPRGYLKAAECLFLFLDSVQISP